MANNSYQSMLKKMPLNQEQPSDITQNKELKQQVNKSTSIDMAAALADSLTPKKGAPNLVPK